MSLGVVSRVALITAILVIAGCSASCACAQGVLQADAQSKLNAAQQEVDKARLELEENYAEYEKVKRKLDEAKAAKNKEAEDAAQSEREKVVASGRKAKSDLAAAQSKLYTISFQIAAAAVQQGQFDLAIQEFTRAANAAPANSQQQISAAQLAQQSAVQKAAFLAAERERKIAANPEVRKAQERLTQARNALKKEEDREQKGPKDALRRAEDALQNNEADLRRAEATLQSLRQQNKRDPKKNSPLDRKIDDVERKVNAAKRDLAESKQAVGRARQTLAKAKVEPRFQREVDEAERILREARRRAEMDIDRKEK